MCVVSLVALLEADRKLRKSLVFFDFLLQNNLQPFPPIDGSGVQDIEFNRWQSAPITSGRSNKGKYL